MTDRIIPTGSERAFVESWCSWKQPGWTVFHFSNCTLTEMVKQATNLWDDADYTVVVNYDDGEIEIYVNEESHPRFTIEWVPSITRVINNKQESK